MSDPQMRDGGEARLKALLAAHYDPVLEESVPERLRAAVVAPAPPLARAGAGWRMPAAMAASLAAGVLIGWGVLGERPASLPDPYASGALAQVLQSGLASAPDPNAAAQVGLSFRTAQGGYCRTFTAKDGLSGLACREPKGWRLRMIVLGPASGPEPAYRTAASALPAPLLAEVDRLASGPPLDASQEAAARAKGWT